MREIAALKNSCNTLFLVVASVGFIGKPVLDRAALAAVLKEPKSLPPGGEFDGNGGARLGDAPSRYTFDRLTAGADQPMAEGTGAGGDCVV